MNTNIVPSLFLNYQGNVQKAHTLCYWSDTTHAQMLLEVIMMSHDVLRMSTWTALVNATMLCCLLCDSLANVHLHKHHVYASLWITAASLDSTMLLCLYIQPCLHAHLHLQCTSTSMSCECTSKSTPTKQSESMMQEQRLVRNNKEVRGHHRSWQVCLCKRT